MRRVRKHAVVTLLFVSAAFPLGAQGTIDPGMSKAQVVAKLGKPASEHSAGTQTFLYYRNGQEKKMGMSDMVALEDDKVVDAVFRAPERKYSGKSSSPAPISAEAAIVKGGGHPSAKPMKIPPAKTAAPPAKAAAPAAKNATPAPTKKP